MYLEKIKIKNFKKIINLETELNKNINIFIGNNAQGKTSILESIYVLALTKPSKSVEESELINKTSDFSLIKGNLRYEKNQKEMEVILTNQEKILKINKKEIKKFIGTLSIVTSCLMILTLISDVSLFGVVYFLLEIFLGVHSFFYLKNFSNSDIQGDYSNEVTVKNKKVKYISLIPILITIILVILGFVFNQSLIGISWCSILILLVNIANIILCIILHHKKIKSVLVYIILVISIMITLSSCLFLIDEIGQKIRKTNYYNNEEFLTKYAKEAEEELQDDIVQAGNLKKLNIDISKENIIILNEFLSTISTNEILSNHMYSINELEKNGYSCNGYAILKFKDAADKDHYNLILNEEYNDTTNMNRFFDINTYISCSGKYSYKTNGFNENIINDRVDN